MHPGVPGAGVRPTKRCLVEDLGEDVPHLRQRLEDVAHDCLEAAQALPQQYEAQGCERVRALTDRVWFKVKTSNHRGAATRLERALVPSNEEHEHPGLGQWWLGAAGLRKGDSNQDDFYDVLQADCERRKKVANQGGANHMSSAITGHLLPEEWDRKRLTAETAEHVRAAMKHHVREMARLSIMNGKIISFVVGEYEVKVLIRMEGGETYLAVATKGVSDERFFAMLLSAFQPLIDPLDWMPEPTSEGLAIVPKDDEMLWSAVLDPEQAASLLDD